MNKETKKEIRALSMNDTKDLLWVLSSEEMTKHFGLNERNMAVFKMRAGDLMEFEDIAIHFEISRERARQIYQQTYSRIRSRMKLLIMQLNLFESERTEFERLRRENSILNSEINFIRSSIDTLSKSFTDITNRTLLIAVEDMGLSVRAYNCIKAVKINTVAELVKYKLSDLLAFRNMGRKSLMEIEDKLKDYGLQFKPEK